MNAEKAADKILSELYQVSEKKGGKPLVNVASRAYDMGIESRETLSEAIALLRDRHWIEEPREGPDGEVYVRITLQGITDNEKRAA